MMQVWTHKTNGKLFVVDTDDNDIVVAAAGPMHRRDIVLAMDGYDSEWDVEIFVSDNARQYDKEPIEAWLTAHA